MPAKKRHSPRSSRASTDKLATPETLPIYSPSFPMSLSCYAESRLRYKAISASSNQVWKLMSTDCSDQKENEPAIGDATMDDDYTIHIRMRRAGSAHVDGRISYKKGSQYYDQVLEHIGGL